MSKPQSFSEETDNILALHQRINSSISGAQTYLRTKFKWAGERVEHLAIGGWSQIVDDEREPSVTGTASAIIVLMINNQTNANEQILSGRKLIEINMREEGGWTKPSLQKTCSLTRITCRTLTALLASNSPLSDKYISKSYEWLINAQNEDGGWGNLHKDGRSDVGSTAYTLQLMARVLGFYSNVGEPIERAKKWLMEARNDDGSWGINKKAKGTLPHTAHATEALIESGVINTDLTASQEWIINHIAEDAQFLDFYTVNIANHEERINWTYVSRERALMSLVKLGVLINSPVIQDSVADILSRQESFSYWHTQVFHEGAASWAMLEAVTALDLYSKSMQQNKSLLIASEEIKRLEVQLVSLEKRIIVLEEHTLSAILRHNKERFSSPRALSVLITAILTVFYIVLRAFIPLPSVADLIAAVVGILSFGFTLYQVVMPRPRD